MVKMLIGGEQTDATATDELDVVDPATEEVYETVPAGGVDAVELAVQAAHAAFAEWSRTDAEQRAQLRELGVASDQGESCSCGRHVAHFAG